MRYSLLAGGKRVRPVLPLATRACRSAQTPERFLSVACAIELIHTYSLIHDDLPAMDDDELRRGQPTSHVRFGEDVAILAGDGLFAEAVRLFCDQPGEPGSVLAALRELAVATGVDGMVGGQYVDVAGSGDRRRGLRALHALKTGRLIAASVGVVLVLEDAGESRDDALSPIRGGAGRPIPDRRRHPRRDRERRAARQAPWQRRATWQTHLRQPLRPRPGAPACRRVARKGERGTRRGRAARPAT